jgi:hypothetical protein
MYTTKIIDKILKDQEEGLKTPIIFYQNIQGLRKPNVLFQYTHDEIIEYGKCMKDPMYFFETYCKINTPTLANIKLREYQKDVIKNYMTNKFNLTVTSRQTGMTTVLALISVYELLFFTHKSVGIMCNKIDSAIEKLDKIKNIYKNVPYFLKPGVTMYNARNMVFDNGSSIHVAAKNCIGRDFDTIIIDEYAHMYKNRDRYSSIIPSIAARKKSKIIISSTPNGLNHFHELVTNAERKNGDPKKNLFNVNKIYWWEVPGRDENWKNEQIKMIGSKELFDQEYDLCFFTHKKDYN